LEKLATTHDVDVQWRSFELRPKDAPPISPEYRAKIEANRPRLYDIARKQYGLEMNPGPFGFDSRPALVGAKFAESQGRGQAYQDAVMRAYWQDARDIGDIDVLAQVAVSAGLDEDAFRAALEDPQYQQAVQTEIDQAHLYGINAVPALIFADKYLVSGAQPYPVLSQATEQVQAELAEGGE
jgi:predicted DsbA family dithiol-disulfide isomerase